MVPIYVNYIRHKGAVYRLDTLCLSGTLPCVGFMCFTMGDRPLRDLLAPDRLLSGQGARNPAGGDTPAANFFAWRAWLRIGPCWFPQGFKGSAVQILA